MTTLLKSAFDTLEGLTVSSEQVENRNCEYLDHGTKPSSVSFFAVARIRIKAFCSREVEIVERPIVVAS